MRLSQSVKLIFLIWLKENITGLNDKDKDLNKKIDFDFDARIDFNYNANNILGTPLDVDISGINLRLDIDNKSFNNSKIYTGEKLIEIYDTKAKTQEK